MEEIQACNLHSCDAYRWRTSDWTPCHLTSNERCGSGLQTRYVRYVSHCKSLLDSFKLIYYVRPNNLINVRFIPQLINLGIEQVRQCLGRHGGGGYNLRWGQQACGRATVPDCLPWALRHQLLVVLVTMPTRTVFFFFLKIRSLLLSNYYINLYNPLWLPVSWREKT
jgi:hypothetical protein